MMKQVKREENIKRTKEKNKKNKKTDKNRKNTRNNNSAAGLQTHRRVAMQKTNKRTGRMLVIIVIEIT